MSLFRTISNKPVSPLGYGAMALGGAAYGPAASDDERFQVLDRLYELGCRHWDTAHVYGDSEELIGKWFKRTGKRDDIFLATKFGIDITKGFDVRGDAKFVNEQLQESLRRLQTDKIDLYYAHRIDKNTPIEITIKAVDEAVKAGKVRYIGLSEASVVTIRRAHAVHPITALQYEYSPVEISIEKPGGIIDVARELGIGIAAYSPVGGGTLTGRYKSPFDFEATDFRRTVPRYSEENFPRILKLAAELENIASAHFPPSTPAQISIAWLLAQSKILGVPIWPIPGSKQLGYAEENWKASEVELSDDEVKKIRALVDNVEEGLAHVPHYSEHQSTVVNIDTPPLGTD